MGRFDGRRLGGWMKTGEGEERGGKQEGSRREEGWSEEEDNAVYHDSLGTRVCPRQTPSRSPDNQGAAILS